MQGSAQGSPVAAMITLLPPNSAGMTITAPVNQRSDPLGVERLEERFGQREVSAWAACTSGVATSV
jgi:hypothetical protein